MQDASVTFIVNLHKEGALCRPTLDSSISAVKYGREQGLHVDYVVVMDRPSSETYEAVASCDQDFDARVIDVGDLSEARNYGVGLAKTKYVAFIDGDDLCCLHWLVSAVAEAELIKSRVVVRPQFNLFFGRNFDNYYWVHPDMRCDRVSLSRLLVENLWTSSILANKDILLDHPYRRNRLVFGYGYEDWVFNIETCLSGICHVSAADTVLFIRRNKAASLMKESGDLNVLPDIDHLVDKIIKLDTHQLSMPLGLWFQGINEKNY